jgi:hypothetical protein
MSHTIEGTSGPSWLVEFGEYSVTFAVTLLVVLGLLRVLGVLD